ncbi:MAG TPA: hypothetical protein VJM33_13820 [Microthrixaceae bacterium]|nr:hypothetical protein [Microthrixaceae bacterium]
MVDACIAATVQAIWDAGFITLGSCCGHGKQAPSLVLGEHERGYDGLIALIEAVDGREFELFQWRLIQLTEVHCPTCTTRRNE